MNRASPSIDRLVQAFRELTEEPVDGAATRARVLVDAGRAAARRAWLRRIGLATATVVVAASSVSAAVTGIQHRWRAQEPARLSETNADLESGSASPQSADRPRRVIPPVATALISAPRTGREEDEQEQEEEDARAYERAHRAHFVDNAPARALAAWSAYLAGFPHGTLAPEASFNRAICLIRLGRRTEAMRALHRFADGPASGYRREEARQLLAWLGASP